MGEDEGLLSGLPKTRPGIATRRRDEARAAASARNDAATGSKRDDEAPPPGPAPAGEASIGGAVEDLARVSAEAAASTAAAGLRLAGRAAGGLGRALTRR